MNQSSASTPKEKMTKEEYEQYMLLSSVEKRLVKLTMEIDELKGQKSLLTMENVELKGQKSQLEGELGVGRLFSDGLPSLGRHNVSASQTPAYGDHTACKTLIVQDDEAFQRSMHPTLSKLHHLEQ